MNSDQILFRFRSDQILGKSDLFRTLDKGLEKDNEITNLKITSESPYSLFFQHAIIFVIILLIIYILWYIFSYLYSSYNEEKNILNYKIPLNRNQGYAFSIQYTEEPKDRTTSYEILPYEYR